MVNHVYIHICPEFARGGAFPGYQFDMVNKAVVKRHSLFRGR